MAAPRVARGVACHVIGTLGEVAVKASLDVWRFSSIMSTAMTMTAAVAHLMELPAKMQYEPSLYVRLHRTLYPTFGRTAGPAEAVAVAATGALAWWMRQRRPRSFPLTATAAGCLAAAHAIFWSVVQPVNVRMMRWPLDAIPADWAKWRDRWEYGHAVRAVLVTTALGALTLSVLADAPARSEEPAPTLV
jgi:Domain of unknown function (DUF1772)